VLQWEKCALVDQVTRLVDEGNVVDVEGSVCGSALSLKNKLGWRQKRF